MGKIFNGCDYGFEKFDGELRANILKFDRNGNLIWAVLYEPSYPEPYEFTCDKIDFKEGILWATGGPSSRFVDDYVHVTKQFDPDNGQVLNVVESEYARKSGGVPNNQQPNFFGDGVIACANGDFIRRSNQIKLGSVGVGDPIIERYASDGTKIWETESMDDSGMYMMNPRDTMTEDFMVSANRGGFGGGEFEYLKTFKKHMSIDGLVEWESNSILDPFTKAYSITSASTSFDGTEYIINKQGSPSNANDDLLSTRYEMRKAEIATGDFISRYIQGAFTGGFEYYSGQTIEFDVVDGTSYMYQIASHSTNGRTAFMRIELSPDTDPTDQVRPWEEVIYPVSGGEINMRLAHDPIGENVIAIGHAGPFGGSPCIQSRTKDGVLNWQHFVGQDKVIIPYQVVCDPATGEIYVCLATAKITITG